MPRETKPPTRLSEREALGLAIKRLRKRADLTQDQAAEALGVQPNSWRRYEWGERNLDLQKLTDIAGAIGASREEILEEARKLSTGPTVEALAPAARGADRSWSPSAPAGDAGLLTIRDRVQAGAWLAADDFVQTPPRTYPTARDPRFPHADQWLDEVVGDSMNALHIFERDLVHCVDAIAIGYAPRNGDLVEVERRRFGGHERELTIKQIEVTAAGVLLWPRSTNPRWREPLELTDGAGEDEEVEVRIRGLVLAATRRF